MWRSWTGYACRAIAGWMACLLLPAWSEGAEFQLVRTEQDPRGVFLHVVRSSYQSGDTHVRVLLPEDLEPRNRIAAVYLLPVEAGREAAYGDSLEEVLRLQLHKRFRVAFVAPSFSHLPWYADHPSDAGIQQESYLLDHVIPFIQSRYPLRQRPSQRHLVGFSKSGWGAFTLILRNPQVFGRAAAWDAPMMMDAPGKYGSGPVFGGNENFRQYHVTRLIEDSHPSFQRQSRLVLTGYAGSFREEHIALHKLMRQQGIQHIYRDGPQRKHDWHSGWLAESLELLFP